MNENEITLSIPDCPECGSKLSDTAAVFWSRDMMKIIEWRASCSNRTCRYVMVHKDE